MRLGKYTLIAPLGKGGMGGVWDVSDDEGNHYALKSPASGMNPSAQTNKRFAREANALRMLDHPNLVAAADVFVEAGFLFLVMERVNGRTLTKAIAEGPFEARRALVLTRQILAGVGHAHSHGLVHRDIKPDNVMLVTNGAPPQIWESAKIVDFGLVKLIGEAEAVMGGAANLTNTGIVFGTPTYMSPEQALGRPVDGRTDLYSVATILFEMLTGRPPFQHDDPMTVMRLQVKAPPPRLDQLLKNPAWCTPQLVALVEAALVKEPKDRFPSAEVMTAALDDAFYSLDHLP
ncbi:MAG: serine/threonine protein kinase with repeat [Myxococcales bacterium]|nr:serine/threonine protein kinase with repeat [Myxococcales bacterium]